MSTETQVTLLWSPQTGGDEPPQLNGNKIREGGRGRPTKRVQLQGKGNKSAAAAWTA